MNSIISHKYIWFFLSISIFIGCINNSNKSENRKQLFLDNNDVKLNRHSIIDTSSYKYIQLETNKESSFGNIDKVIIDSCRIIILDRKIARKALIFNLDGTFICGIGKEGKGPDEYKLIQDIDIDIDKKQIILYDIRSLKLLHYDYNGNFIKRTKLKEYPGMTLGVISSNKYAFYLHRSIENRKNQLLYYSGNGNLVAQKFKFRNSNIVQTMPDYFARQRDNLLFIPIFEDKMFRIQNDGNISEVFDFQISELMVTDIDKKHNETTEELIKLKKYLNFKNLSVSINNQFYCYVNYNGKPVSIIGNLKSNKLKIGSLLLGAGDMPGQIFGTYKNYFIGSFHPSQHRLKLRFPNASIADNPGILLFEFHDTFIDNTD